MKDFIIKTVVPFVAGVAVTGFFLWVLSLAGNFNGF